jgi:hypothetical protein
MFRQLTVGRAMTLAIAASALLAPLSGCARATSPAYEEPFVFTTTTLWEQDEELNGYVQPEACRRDLSDVGAPVRFVADSWLRDLFRDARVDMPNDHGTWGGAAVTPEHALVLGVLPGIYINDRLPNGLVAIAIHHERCHWTTGWQHSDWKPRQR